MGRSMGACKGSADPQGGLEIRRDLGRGQAWAWGRFVAQVGRRLAEPEQPLVCLSPFSPLLSLLTFTLKAPTLPAIQQPNLFTVSALAY